MISKIQNLNYLATSKVSAMEKYKLNIAINPDVIQKATLRNSLI